MQHRFDVQVGEATYTIQHFSPTKAVPILIRIANLLGLSLAGGGAKLDQDVAGAMLKGVGDLLNRMNEKEVMSLIKDLMSSVFVGVQPVDIDAQFRGKLGDLFEVLGHVVRIQYTDFFERATKLVTDLIRSAMTKAGVAKSGSDLSRGSFGVPSSEG